MIRLDCNNKRKL